MKSTTAVTQGRPSKDDRLDLVSGDDVFVAATGVTTGALLRGVRYLPNGAATDSIVMRSRSGTVRRIEATHQLDKLEALSGREYR